MFDLYQNKKDSKFQNNLIDQGLLGLQIWTTENIGGVTQEIQVWNNTFVGVSTQTKSHGFQSIGVALGTTGVYNLQNNIIVGYDWAVTRAGETEPGCIVDYNLTNTHLGSFAFGIELVPPGPNNLVGVDPLFVAPSTTVGAGDYRLSDTSPAKDAANPTLFPAADFLGVARPNGARADIGAYENNTPPTSVDDWSLY